MRFIACDFDCEFRFKTKAVAFKGNRIEDASFKNLIAGFHVRQVQIGEHIGQGGQEHIAQVMPEKKYAMRLS